MASHTQTNWWQKVILATSLLANTSDFALLDDATTMTSISTSTFLPQYTPPPSVDQGAPLLPNIRDPLAIAAQHACPGYLLSNIWQSGTGLGARLSMAGEQCHVYGNDVEELQLNVEYQAQQRLHVNIRPTHTSAENESWYHLPQELVPEPQTGNVSIGESDLLFLWTNDPTFGFSITRNGSNETLFSTIGTKLVYEDQFLEFMTAMDEGYNLYGLGEVFRGLRLQPGLTRTIYAADAGDPIDGNIYGSHPFYLNTKYSEQDGKNSSSSHGVYLRNAHGQEILMGDRNVTWRTLGGEIDLYFFSGPSQPDVTQQYLQQIGLPVMQQYWTFGYHQCRWGYANWSQTEEVVDTFANFELPLETIWNDIDYMQSYRDFENDPVRFSYDEGACFTDKLHGNGQHYVPIVDAAIYHPNPTNDSDAYPVFDDGQKGDVFLKNPDGSLYLGQVWPGYTVFPDWLSSNATSWWVKTVGDWYSKLKFDGLWMDMSEVSSFCVGSCGSGQLDKNPVHPWFNLQGENCEIVYDYPEGFNLTNATEAVVISAAATAQAAGCSSTTTPTTTSYLRTTPTPGKRNVNHPPYVLNHIQGDLAVHAVSPNATHQDGTHEYDVHNLYGHMLLRNTYAAIKKAQPGLRPFIIGRSTFAGSGNYSGHWGGDNSAQFRHMYWSIPQALSFSLFGIPMFGVDTCGFNGNTDEELCNRWMQLSAFFPFYLNHNTLGAISQEPYRWASVLDATKTAMNVRFQLLPYLYTLFYYAHTGGYTVMRALAWEFPDHPSLADADRQFMLGHSILVTPVLTQGATTVNGVFPGLMEGNEIYYDWYNQSAVPKPTVRNTTIDAPLGHIPVYIRGGHILATQEMRMTTREARESDWSLIVALGVDGSAKNPLFLDDGVSIEPNATKLVTMVAQATVQDVDGLKVSKLNINVSVEGEYSGLDLPLANVTVLGLEAPPVSDEVLINGQVVSGQGSGIGVEYCAETRRLIIYGLQRVLEGKVWKQSWSLSI